MMKSVIQKSYLTIGLLYGAAGMSLGIHMAATQNHRQAVTHAHILLVGFLLSVLYAIIHRLWLQAPGRAITAIQFAMHQLGTVIMVTALYHLYAGRRSIESLEPFLASASIMVLLALLLMLVMVWLSRPAVPT